MKDILSRKSVIAFILLALLGLFGPALLPRSPYEFAGAPFARPVWWRSGSLPTNVSYNITNAETSIRWNKKPPAIFALAGAVKARPVSELQGEIRLKSWIRIPCRISQTDFNFHPELPAPAHRSPDCPCRLCSPEPVSGRRPVRLPEVRPQIPDASCHLAQTSGFLSFESQK